jgi:hypothetical protein
MGANLACPDHLFQKFRQFFFGFQRRFRDGLREFGDSQRLRRFSQRA